MDFNVGEKVRVKKQLVPGMTKGGVTVTYSMKRYFGKEFLVKDKSFNGKRYTLCPLSKKSRSQVFYYVWDEYCLERCCIKFK